MPRFPYVAEIPKSADFSWVSVAEGTIRAIDADTAEIKVRKKYPKAQHIEIMEAIPFDDAFFPGWDYWRPFAIGSFCTLLVLLLVAVVVSWVLMSRPSEPVPPPEEKVGIELYEPPSPEKEKGPEDFDTPDEEPPAHAYDMLWD